MTIYTLLKTGYIRNEDTGAMSPLGRSNHLSAQVLDDLIAAGCAKEDTRSGEVLPIVDGVNLIAEADEVVESPTPTKKKTKASS